jgi:hypothetical protein
MFGGIGPIELLVFVLVSGVFLAGRPVLASLSTCC